MLPHAAGCWCCRRPQTDHFPHNAPIQTLTSISVRGSKQSVVPGQLSTGTGGQFEAGVNRSHSSALRGRFKTTEGNQTPVGNSVLSWQPSISAFHEAVCYCGDDAFGRCSYTDKRLDAPKNLRKFDFVSGEHSVYPINRSVACAVVIRMFIQISTTLPYSEPMPHRDAARSDSKFR